MECEVEGERVEFVVKLSRSNEMDSGSLVRELLASIIASKLGLSIPDPAIVHIGLDLCNAAIGIEKRDVLIQSCGLNFGSRYLTPQTDISIDSHQLSSAERVKALEIFAFDALIRNPDRRTDKPNLFHHKKNLYAIDHELAFSFLFDILKKEPWTFESFGFLRAHLFYKALHGKEADFNDIKRKVQEFFDNGTLAEALALIPSEWMEKAGEMVEAIRAHFEKIEKHQNEFFDSLRLLLS